MQYKNTVNSYGLFSICLHWTGALLVILLFLIGWYMVKLDYYDTWYNTAPWLHKGLGVIVVLLYIIRYCWILYSGKPVALNNSRYYEHILSRVMHALFYLVVLMLSATGYLMTGASGAAIELFDLADLPSLMELNEVTVDLLGELHKWGAYMLMLMLILHSLAALKHHYIDRDLTLKRIIQPGLMEDK